MTIARNIVIIPAGEAADTCRVWSGLIADAIPSVIDLRRPSMIPHVSLYNTAFPDGSDDALQETLRSFAAERTRFNVRLIEAITFHGYIFANADVTTEITSIHRDLIQTLNDVRNGSFNEFELALGLTDEETTRLKNTGMTLSLDAFMPHVTLARPTDPTRAHEALSLVPDVRIAFPATSIHLVETGPNGTCKKIMASFPLGA